MVELSAADVLGLRKRRVVSALWILGLTVGVIIAAAGALALGSVPVHPLDTLQIVTHHLFHTPSSGSWSASTDAIVWQVRLPRVLLALVVGAGLAVCGMALQAMVRNVLAEPYILGINSGASTGAAAAIILGFGVGFWGEHSLQALAFLGALAAAVLVFAIARSTGQLTSIRLLLSGVAVGYALNAVTSFLIFASGDAEGARSVMFWLLGSLSLAEWGSPLVVSTIVVVVTIIVLTLRARTLDILSIGDETATTLGVSPARSRALLLVLISLCIGVIVASSGSIGFVGLIVPHLARRAVGVGHARAVPVAALMGGLLMVLADLAARTMLAPQELPIGILTALVGAPFLVVLIRRMRGQRA